MSRILTVTKCHQLYMLIYVNISLEQVCYALRSKLLKKKKKKEKPNPFIYLIALRLLLILFCHNPNRSFINFMIKLVRTIRLLNIFPVG